MLVVDVYNVLHTTGVLPADLAGLGLDGLLRLLGTSRYARHESTLVCDGAPPPRARSAHAGGAPAPPDRGAPAQPKVRGRTRGSVQVVYAGGGRDADAVIEKLLADLPKSKRPLVVSSDRRVQRAARLRRFEVRDSEQFLRHLALDHASAQLGAGKAPKRAELRALVPLDRTSVALWSRHLAADDAAWLEELTRLLADPPAAAAPAPAASAAPSPAARRPGKAGSKRAGRAPKAPPAAAPAPPAIDADLQQLLKQSSAEVHPDDLDMQRWLRDAKIPDRPSTPPAAAKPGPRRPRGSP